MITEQQRFCADRDNMHMTTREDPMVCDYCDRMIRARSRHAEIVCDEGVTVMHPACWVDHCDDVERGSR